LAELKKATLQSFIQEPEAMFALQRQAAHEASLMRIPVMPHGKPVSCKVSVTKSPARCPLPPRRNLSAVGPAPVGVHKPAVPQVRPPSGKYSYGHLPRQNVWRPVGPVIKTVAPREEPRFHSKSPPVETAPHESLEMKKCFVEREVLGQKCLHLTDEIERRSCELAALRRYNDGLQREFMRCQEAKRVLEAEVEAMNVQNEETPTCVICLDEEASHVMVPCGHLALCADCCSLPLSACPVCMQSCEHKMRLFKP
jgi:hypothetical protein